MKTSLAVSVLAAAALCLGACTKETKTDSKPMPTKTAAPAKTGNMGVMNSKCPISGEEIDPQVTADYNGGKVGFCCSNCKGKFNNLSDADKAAKLAAAK